MASIFDSSEFNQSLFFPRPDLSPAPAGADEIFIEVESSIEVHARRYPSPEAKATMLFFHGNGEIVADYDGLAAYYCGLGVEFIVCDYRGYGKSGGAPSLRTVLKDSHIIYDTLNNTGKLRQHVGVMGRSLGSASAIELCVHHPEICFCIIESGYADPIPLVERRGLKIDGITAEEEALFNNSTKISQVRCPVLIMHGADDFLISPKEAELNYKKAGAEAKFLEILEGVGHNDMMMAPQNSYFSNLQRFLDSVPEMQRG